MLSREVFVIQWFATLIARSWWYEKRQRCRTTSDLLPSLPLPKETSKEEDEIHIIEMSGPRRRHGTPGEQRVSLEDVRHLELSYSRARPEKMEICVEYVGGRIRVFEVDTYLVERLLEQLEDQEA